MANISNTHPGNVNTVHIEFLFENFEIKHSEDLGINEDNIASSSVQNHAYTPTAYNV